MKDQYFGDVNDYLKYGLLRCCAEVGWSVGVCWMLTPSDGRTDGNKTQYLTHSGMWRQHDPSLFDQLTGALAPGNRRVSYLEEIGAISGATYFSDFVPDNVALWRLWFERGMTKMKAAHLLFFDPDNGIEVGSKPAGSHDSNKYVLWSEIASAWRRGYSLLLFQHFARENRQDHVARLGARLKEEAKSAAVSVYWTSNVAYLLATQPGHAERLTSLERTVRARWEPRITQSAVFRTATPRVLPRVEQRPVTTSLNSVATADVITNVQGLRASDVAKRKVLCPSCGSHIFQMWPFGWDAHAHRCTGLAQHGASARKAEFKAKYGHLFR